MITVHLRTADFAENIRHETGIYATPDENGWIHVMDRDGFTLAMYPKEKVIRLEIEKAGENEVTSEDTN